MVEYPMEQPIVVPPAAKDKRLGKDKIHAAKSCIDIKVNNIDVESGL